MTAVFKANTSHLPAYVGVEDAQGYTVYRVSQVAPGAEPSADQVSSSTDALRRTQGQQELRAFVSTLRDRTKVEINAANVDKTTTQQQ